MSTHIKLFTTLILLLFSITAACSSYESQFGDKPKKDVLVEIFDSEVVKLNGKEIHITFLDNQISNMASDFRLTSEVRVHQDAPFHVVRDAQTSLRQYSSGIAYKAEGLP